MTINGSGFVSTAGGMQVIVTDAQNRVALAQIVEVNQTRIRVRVPFGAGTGQVSVKTAQGESAKPALSLRTSVSGFVEEAAKDASGATQRRAIANANVAARPLLPPGASKSLRTNTDGTFVIGDLAPGLYAIEIDSGTSGVTFPKTTFSMNVQGNRDNQLPTTAEVRSTQQGGSLANNAGQNGGAMTTINQGSATATTFGLPNGCRVTTAPDPVNGRMTISLLDPERVPAALPFGTFSSTIAQVSPFGAVMSPGGTLRLPNTDNLNSGQNVKLYRFIQPTSSDGNPSMLGKFIETGVGTVNGSSITAIETGGNATNGIKESSFFFVSPVYPTARIAGRVLTNDGLPATNAVVGVRGQFAYTDGNGNFTLENIPVIRSGDSVTLEISYMRPDSKVDRTTRGLVAISSGGLATLERDIVMPMNISPGQPTVLVPPRLTINEGQSLDFEIYANPVSQIALAASGFTASTTFKSDGIYNLRLGSGSGSAGEYTLLLTVMGNNGAVTLQTVSVRVRRLVAGLPTSNDLCIVTTVGMAKALTLTANDIQGRALVLNLVGQASNGTFGGLNPNLIYMPRSGFTGTDVAAYRAVVSNSTIASEPSAIYVIVR